jgi:hypothetical protein
MTVGARYIVPLPYRVVRKNTKKPAERRAFLTQTVAQEACLQLKNIRN